MGGTKVSGVVRERLPLRPPDNNMVDAVPKPSVLAAVGRFRGRGDRGTGGRYDEMATALPSTGR
jgi:hypothetical protein